MSGWISFMTPKRRLYSPSGLKHCNAQPLGPKRTLIRAKPSVKPPLNRLAYRAVRRWELDLLEQVQQAQQMRARDLLGRHIAAVLVAELACGRAHANRAVRRWHASDARAERVHGPSYR